MGRGRWVKTPSYALHPRDINTVKTALWTCAACGQVNGPVRDHCRLCGRGKLTRIVGSLSGSDVKEFRGAAAGLFPELGPPDVGADSQGVYARWALGGFEVRLLDFLA